MRLIVGEPGPGERPHRAMSEPGVTVWRDAGGTPWGYGYADSTEHWMLVPGIGSFRFGPHPGIIHAHPHDRTPLVRLHEVYERAVLPLALQALGLEVLHASAVRLDRGVVALCGVSGAGKSTMAHALEQRGHHACADDALALDLHEESPRTIPLPFRVRPRPRDGPRREERLTEPPTVRDHGVDHQSHVAPARLTALFVLTRTAAGADISLTPLAPAAAFAAVLPHAYCFSLEDESRKRRMLAAYFRLVASVPVFKVVFGHGLQRLSVILDAIERAAASSGTRAE